MCGNAERVNKLFVTFIFVLIASFVVVVGLLRIE